MNADIPLAYAKEAQRVLTSIDGIDVFEETTTGRQVEQLHQALVSLASIVREVAGLVAEIAGARA